MLLRPHADLVLRIQVHDFDRVAVGLEVALQSEHVLVPQLHLVLKQHLPLAVDVVAGLLVPEVVAVRLDIAVESEEVELLDAEEPGEVNAHGGDRGVHVERVSRFHEVLHHSFRPVPQTFGDLVLEEGGRLADQGGVEVALPRRRRSVLLDRLFVVGLVALPHVEIVDDQVVRPELTLQRHPVDRDGVLALEPPPIEVPHARATAKEEGFLPLPLARDSSDRTPRVHHYVVRHCHQFRQPLSTGCLLGVLHGVTNTLEVALPPTVVVELLLGVTPLVPRSIEQLSFSSCSFHPCFPWLGGVR